MLSVSVEAAFNFGATVWSCYRFFGREHHIQCISFCFLLSCKGMYSLKFELQQSGHLGKMK